MMNSNMLKTHHRRRLPLTYRPVRQMHQPIGIIVSALGLPMATNTLVSSEMTNTTDKALTPLVQIPNLLAINTLVSTRITNGTDKALTPSPTATDTLVSSGMTQATDKALTPLPVATNTLVSTGMAKGTDKALIPMPTA